MNRWFILFAIAMAAIIAYCAGDTIIENVSDSGVRGLLAFIFGVVTYMRSKSAWGKSLGLLLMLAPFYETMLVDAILERISG
jgi:hypothetical protein